MTEVRAATVVLLLALASHALQGQSPPRGAVGRTDSLRILKAAKAAQARFESRRRFLAPRTFEGSGGTCQHIGRFCRHPSRVPPDQIPNEPAATGRARGQLLESLGSAATKLPGDDWIVGQRVRYIIESGNDSAALDVARNCGATLWWCDALLGLASHASGNFVSAEQAFARSLREMPAGQRCEWTDLLLLLEGESLERYRKLDCNSREAANRRIWWLADPLFSTPGNERRTEHYARHVWSDIERGGANGFGMSWGGDMGEMIVRFGWAEKWTQLATSGSSYARASYVSHEREPDYHFLPVLSYQAPISAVADSAWNLDETEPPEGYSPRYAGRFTRIHPQVARFRRGDSTLVVAGYDVTGDTAWDSDAVRAALIIAPNDSTRFSIALFDSAAKRGALWVSAGTEEMLASVEVVSLDGRTAGRWRSAIKRIPADLAATAVSDLLLFDATDSLASDLDGATATAYGSEMIPQDRKTGVYWETYGETPGDSALAVSLTLTPAAPGIATRAIRALGIGKKLFPVDLRWRDTGGRAEIVPRSLLLDLSQIIPARYELRLTLGEGSRARTVARNIVVESAGRVSGAVR